jgi:AcrR family transcriptional regulator
VADTASATPDQRSRILDAALTLMSDKGSAGASMRQLAAACDLNVATLYHYFPSKADLLLSLLSERRYGERLGSEAPPLDATAPPKERLVALLTWLWENALGEEQVLRLLVGEAMRGDRDAGGSLSEVVELLELTLTGWLTDGFPELDGDRSVLSRMLSAQVFSLVVEHLALGTITDVVAKARIAEVADVVLGPARRTA